MYSYPQGQLVGSIKGFESAWECGDASGHVFVVDESTVYEFAHGETSPIAQFYLPDPGNACAVDSDSGAFAVVSFSHSFYVFPTQQSAPTRYDDDSFQEIDSLTYDGAHNLFASGVADGTHSFMLAELPRGGSVLGTISTPINGATGSLQWDGQFLGIATRPRNKGNGHLFQLNVSGSSAHIVHSAKLNHGKLGDFTNISFALQGAVIALPLAPHTLAFWKYPLGGSPLQTIKIGDRNQYPNAPVFSAAPGR